MLKNLDPLLSAELLFVLRSMGHGDELALVDCNFPAASVAEQTVSGRLVSLDGIDLPRAAEAILSVFPLDSFVETPIYRMEVVGNPRELAPVQRDVEAVISRDEAHQWGMGSIERHAFYDRARRSYAVVATGERRPYGCFILVKGVLGPDGKVV
jgi:L-fucose mutarotase